MFMNKKFGNNLNKSNTLILKKKWFYLANKKAREKFP